MIPEDGERAPEGEPATAEDQLPGPVVLARLETVSETLDGITGRLAALSGRERRTRQLAIGLTISFIVDIVLTIGVTLLTLNTVHQNSAIHASQLAACTITNQTRADELTLWDYIITLSGKSPQTPQSRKELADLRIFVDQTFAPVDCTKLYKEPG